jgi:ubiquinone/menaquinone biosynthesis C-methylase UbiE
LSHLIQLLRIDMSNFESNSESSNSESNVDTLPPLHTQNPLERFANRADDYAKYRPSYPTAAIDAILHATLHADRVGDPTKLRFADIGAGTGISSRLLADRGVTVWAIEPNAAMRAAAQPHANVEYRHGTAEHTGLPDQSVDGILCCQAFHWFEPVAALTEFRRILKPGGQVALMWNDRNRQDEFTEAYTHVIAQAVDPRYLERLDRKASEAEALRTSDLFTNYRALTFSNTHQLDQAGLIGIALSASYVPKQGDLHQQLLANLAALYDRWSRPSATDPGQAFVTLSYCTNLFLATAPS